MAEKPTVAFYWCASCGGCEEAVVDVAHGILDIVNAVNIGFWPVALDFKKGDVEDVPDGFYAATFINGAIRNSEQEEMVKLLRKKSGLVFALGACAHLGGIPSLANLTSKEEILEYVYRRSPSTENAQNTYPAKVYRDAAIKLELPEFFDRVYPLNQIIDVDYYIPGCAPPSELVADVFMKILKGELPKKGAVLSPNKSLCSSCFLNDTKPEKLLIKELKRPHLTVIDPDKCFLLQGLVCMGPATRTGCNERCIHGGMPCRGCFGPLDGVLDQGLSMLSALGSILDFTPEQEKELDGVIGKIGDPAGTFYRFSLGASIFYRQDGKRGGE
ncbi:MAG: hypothetical protein N2745_01580 [Syntrophorhabdaceae bacterium]|nr:hypothetical protein [Syntrophorhabdaceae bacterium]